ncbi:molybdopterin-guanine dinucleotide biosynthesis protein MobB [Desulfonatronum sp. SC1]|uniref:molybdopterin-guanine dinucleotide biosynthesis protein MobB n=1 Tax=Desulfonatronum sp. SC1 TaxID=2109626 RepID=UPI001304C38B|nr:molybdopterin-guanine dinucleotide biosynthesis protein MobB [Desulfonatronum sp. SC1]
MTTRAMGFVGFHKSGKTTLVTQVAKQLRDQGHRVGIIKSSHHLFDLGAMDTGRLAGTGCPVAGINPDQTMLLLPKAMPVMAAWSLLDADILLVEGGKKMNFLPRIILPRIEPDSGDDPAALADGLALAVWEQERSTGLPVCATVEDVADLVLRRGFLLPALNCGACGREDCGELARDMVAGRAVPEDCKAVEDSFSVRVNGVPLGMNPFVARVMASTLRGMLCQLKGYAPGAIDVHLGPAPGGTS